MHDFFGRKHDEWDGFGRVRAILAEPGEKPIIRYIKASDLAKANRERRFGRIDITTDIAIWDEGNGRANGSVCGIPLRGTVIATGTLQHGGRIVRPWHLPRECGEAWFEDLLKRGK